MLVELCRVELCSVSHLFSIILSVIVLSVIMLNVVMLSVMAPGTQCGCAGIFPRKDGGIRVLAGLAQSSQTVGS
jgi:hypothetical protein